MNRLAMAETIRGASSAFSEPEVSAFTDAIEDVLATEAEGLFSLKAVPEGADEAVSAMAVLVLPAGFVQQDAFAIGAADAATATVKATADDAKELLPSELELEVSCGELTGFLDLRHAAAGRFYVRLPDGRVFKPAQFEAAAGLARHKKWRKNVRVVKTGERFEAWLARNQGTAGAAVQGVQS